MNPEQQTEQTIDKMKYDIKTKYQSQKVFTHKKLVFEISSLVFLILAIAYSYALSLPVPRPNYDQNVYNILGPLLFLVFICYIFFLLGYELGSFRKNYQIIKRDTHEL